MPREVTLRLPPEKDPEQLEPDELISRICRELGWKQEQIGAMRQDRTSLDARPGSSWRRHLACVTFNPYFCSQYC